MRLTAGVIRIPSLQEHNLLRSSQQKSSEESKQKFTAAVGTFGRNGGIADREQSYSKNQSPQLPQLQPS
jgi:hypothetical protein